MQQTAILPQQIAQHTTLLAGKRLAPERAAQNFVACRARLGPTRAHWARGQRYGFLIRSHQEGQSLALSAHRPKLRCRPARIASAPRCRPPDPLAIACRPRSAAVGNFSDGRRPTILVVPPAVSFAPIAAVRRIAIEPPGRPWRDILAELLAEFSPFTAPGGGPQSGLRRAPDRSSV